MSPEAGIKALKEIVALTEGFPSPNEEWYRWAFGRAVGIATMALKEIECISK